MNVKLSEEQKIHVLNSTDVYKVMQQVLLRENKIRRNQEHFWVVGLNNRNKILFVELISLGGANRVSIAPPEVFRMAIYKLAIKLILVHNHPSGVTIVSDADEDFTDRMIKSGHMLNIEVVDHLIITDTEYLSFEEKGWMDMLRNSGAYELIPREQAELKAMRAKAEKEIAIHDAKVEMAKKMMKDSLSIDTIKKYTGLTKGEIERLK